MNTNTHRPDEALPLRQWALLPLRLIVGFGFLVHGLAKLTRGPEGFGKLLDQIGVPFPLLNAWIVTLTEILGGIALIVGFLVAIVSIPLIATMLVAMFTVHLPNGFSSVKTIGLTDAGPVYGPPGYELNLVYIGALLVVAALGPGPLAPGAAVRGEKAGAGRLDTRSRVVTGAP